MFNFIAKVEHIRNETMSRLVDEGFLRGICSYILLNNKGEFLVEEVGDVCYARMKLSLVQASKVAVILNFPHFRKEYEKEHKEIYHWLANESIVKDVFLTKDTDVMFSAGMLINPEAPRDVLFFALTYGRTFFEEGERLRVYKALRAKGVSVREAAYLSLMFKEKDGFFWYAPSSGNHSPFDGYYISQYKDFINGPLKPNQGKYVEAFKGRMGVFALFPNKMGKTFKEVFVMEQKLIKKGWGDAARVYGFSSVDKLISEWGRVTKGVKGKAVRKGKHPPLIAAICMKNGFTLGEVRSIRKNLYALNIPEGRLNRKLDGAFTWGDTPQGYRYWSEIHMILKEVGGYEW